ncbi:hypothetical protein [Planococcus koreensis]|uniref:hypothetical protein n=1 Tax=Planococcus koreensis TaxID=112331 RepID=UPI0039FDD099
MDNRSEAIHTTAAAITIDGPGGESYMEDGAFSTLVSLPREMGGKGEGFSPAKFLALSCSSSFSFTMADIMEEAGLAGRTRISCKVSMIPDATGGVLSLRWHWMYRLKDWLYRKYSHWRIVHLSDARFQMQ